MNSRPPVQVHLQPVAGLQRDVHNYLIANVITPVPGAAVLEVWLNAKTCSIRVTASCGCVAEGDVLDPSSIRVTASCGCVAEGDVLDLVKQLLRNVSSHGDKLGGKHGA